MIALDLPEPVPPVQVDNVPVGGPHLPPELLVRDQRQLRARRVEPHLPGSAGAEQLTEADQVRVNDGHVRPEHGDGVVSDENVALKKENKRLAKRDSITSLTQL